MSSRRNLLLWYKQLILDTLSIAKHLDPTTFVHCDVVVAATRIKLHRQLDPQEFRELLVELSSEGLIECDGKFQLLRAGTFQPAIQVGEMHSQETEYEKYLRLTERRLKTFLHREMQLRRDMSTLEHLLPPTQFRTKDLRLPLEWQQDKRRKDESYVAQCLWGLHLANKIQWQEESSSWKRL